MNAKSILFVSQDDEIEKIPDDALRKDFRLFFAYPGQIPKEAAREKIVLLVVTSYSLQELMNQTPGLRELLRELPKKLPRLYLLRESEPSLCLAPLGGEQRFFYLRGPISEHSLRNAVNQILAHKARPVRREASPELGLRARFTLRPRQERPATYIKDIMEISSNGFSFLWDYHAPLVYPGDKLEALELRAHERPFLCSEARVKHITPVERDGVFDGLRVGVELLEARSSSSEEANGEGHLDDPMVIRAILVEAVDRQTPMILRSENQGWEQHGTLSLCENDNLLSMPINQSNVPVDFARLDIVQCQFVRDNAQLQFNSVITVLDPHREIRFRFPKRLDRLWARSTLRYTFEEDEQPRVIIRSPIDPAHPIERQVSNLSPNGLRFWSDATHDLLLQGMLLDNVELEFPDGPRISVRAEIRYLGSRTGSPLPKRIPCGVQFRGVRAADSDALVTYLISKNYPKVREATADEAESLWAFLERASFFTPAKQAASVGKAGACKETHTRMLQAPQSFSRKLVFRDKGKIYGTVSLQQIYGHTWLVHHLCAIRHPAEFVPRGLLLYLGEYISKTPEIEYVKMMWRPNNTWSNRMFRRLIHRLHDEEKSIVKVYSYFQRPTGPMPAPSPEEAEWNIVPIHPEDAAQLEAYFINKEDFYLMKSEDLVRGQIGIQSLDARYRALGLFRERKVFAAYEGRRVVGFTLAERSSTGLNLSNLLNAFQVHICIQDEERIPALKQALIRRTVDYYTSHGQSMSVALSEDHDNLALEELGFTKIKEYVSWTFDQSIANIYNLYCYYIFRVYERLEGKRQARMTAAAS